MEKASGKGKTDVNELKESKGDVQAKVNDLNTQLMNNFEPDHSFRKPACTEKSGADREEGSDRGHKKTSLKMQKKQEEQQYADMKVRIQFMYENAQESYFEALFDRKVFRNF